MTYPKVIDNRRSTMLEALQQIAMNFDEVSIATGYWDLKGMAALLPNIEHYKKIRILIGQEPLRNRFKKVLKNDTQDDFPEEDLKWDLANTDYDSNLVKTGIRISELIAAGNLEVRIYRGSFLHAKAYIFSSSEKNEAVGLIGSSNFTHAGLTTNTELNALEDESRIVKYKPENETDMHGHLSWFNEIWSDEKSEVWNGEFSKIIQESPLGNLCFSPYEMYMKTLWELYKDEVDLSNEISKLTSSSLFTFQQRNARLLIQKLQKYGVAMLADSVGLGKTITAGAVIKEYIETFKARRIYIIVPASLVQQWKRDLAKVHGLISGFEVLSMQDFQNIERAREIDKYADVNLFVIDEAHNLRNPNGTRHEQLLDWFSNSPESHVLLLTATPINNKLTDFVNQIQLAAKGRLSTFPVVYPTAKKREVIDFFEAVKRLTADMQAAENKGEKPDYKLVSRIMRQGLRHFLVRTTRRGIEAEFGGLLSEDGVLRKFPKSKVLTHPYIFTDNLGESINLAIDKSILTFEGFDPRSIDLELLLNQTQRTKHPLDLIVGDDSENQTISKDGVFEKIFRLILLLGFAPYKIATYANQFYGKSGEELREFKISPDESFRLRSQMSVHNLMRVTFLKRLESSQSALSISLSQYVKKIDSFSKYLEDGNIVSIKNISEIEKEFGDDLNNWDEDSVRRELDIELIPADKNKYKVEQLKKDLQRDRDIIKVIQECCSILESQDNKLQSLVDLIKQIRGNKENGEKFLLFSYFADTIKYLEYKLPKLLNDPGFDKRSAFLTGSNRSELENIVKRFSPISTGSEVNVEEQIDFLFSTDVLSEGQNLQDCGVLINYDLHWNPVRMIQRNGRINRLGSRFENVNIYNLHPETSLDSYLKLVNRLERKIDAIKFTIGTDQSVLGEEENPIEFLDGIEENEELKSVLQLYNSPESSNVFDTFDDDDMLLSEDEFIIELRKFLNVSSPEAISRVKNIPIGKWGYLPKNTKVKSNNALSLTEITGYVESTRKDFSLHFFIESDSNDGMVGAIDMIDALSSIKCDSSDSDKQSDTISLNRNQVKKLVIAASREESKSSTSTVRFTPTKVRILDYLASALPGLGLSLQLNNISTKQQLRKVEGMFLAANKELKAHNQLLPTTLENFTKLTKELAESKPEERTIDEVKTVLFYVAK